MSRASAIALAGRAGELVDFVRALRRDTVRLGTTVNRQLLTVNLFQTFIHG